MKHAKMVKEELSLDKTKNKNSWADSIARDEKCQGGIQDITK